MVFCFGVVVFFLFFLQANGSRPSHLDQSSISVSCQPPSFTGRWLPRCEPAMKTVSQARPGQARLAFAQRLCAHGGFTQGEAAWLYLQLCHPPLTVHHHLLHLFLLQHLHLYLNHPRTLLGYISPATAQ